LGLACLGLVAAAALLWGASALTWHTTTSPGRAPVATSGAEAAPSLSGFAWVALAGVAALVATGGPVRRVLAALLGLAGAAVAVIGVGGWTHAGPSSTPAPLLAVAGGLLLIAVGTFVLFREPRLSRLGARYAAPGTRAVEIDPDRAAWQDLDAGRDPTAGPARDEGDDPDVGAGGGAG
jgi:hypothetical protein